MTQEANPNNQKSIKLEGIANDESKLTQIGSIEAENFHLTTQQIQFLFYLKTNTKSESPGIVKLSICSDFSVVLRVRSLSVEIMYTSQLTKMSDSEALRRNHILTMVFGCLCSWLHGWFRR